MSLLISLILISIFLPLSVMSLLVADISLSLSLRSDRVELSESSMVEEEECKGGGGEGDLINSKVCPHAEFTTKLFYMYKLSLLLIIKVIIV